MNASTETHLYRSEAFAEDVLDLVARAPDSETLKDSPSWLINAVPVALALLGVAFAVLPSMT